MPYLTDSVDLAGGACVWLCKNRRPPLNPTIEQRKEGEKEGDDKQWLSGRLICATWDFDELVKSKEDVVEGDLLTWRMVV